MKIEINQTLHGYNNGHQLLMSSVALSNTVKKILLFQSDLSGPNVTNGFKIYITGYPIISENTYVFSKTWYADEMKRPGCVWTHSLLIGFADLGKLPDLNRLTTYFKRPNGDIYHEYSNPILLGKETVLADANNIYERFQDKAYQLLSWATYTQCAKTIIIPTLSSDFYESALINIWSDQWPRLRRNFSFCSGAMNLKFINERPFDLQVVPNSNLNLIERQMDNLFILDHKDIDETIWLRTIEEFPQNALRKFLWTYGSDVKGERSNYIPLLLLFRELNQNSKNINTISTFIANTFPSKVEAGLLKNTVYGRNNTLTEISELEKMKFLLTSSNVDYLNLDELDIENRLLDLLHSKTLTIYELLSLLDNSIIDRISPDFIERIEIDNYELIPQLELHPQLINTLIQMTPSFALNNDIWFLPIDLQQQVLFTLIKSKKVKYWKPYITAILGAHSPIIFTSIKELGDDVVFLSLDWINNHTSNNSYLEELGQFILHERFYTFSDWILGNKYHINVTTFNLIFLYLDIKKLQRLNLPYDVWIKGYHELRRFESANHIYISCTILSIGLNNRVKGSEAIIVEVFQDVYDYARTAKIENYVWEIIPKDIEDEEDYNDDFNPVSFFFSYFGIVSKRKQSQIPYWDYCEFLIRILLQRFIKHSWSTQAFLDSLKDKETFQRTIEYALSYKKGVQFINRLLNDIKNRNLHLREFQYDLYRILSSK